MHSQRHPEIPEHEPIRLARPRRKTYRHHFCDGIEAAVKAEPSAFMATRPRTMLGLMVRELVRGAAGGRCDQIKLVIFFLDEAERRRMAAEQIAAPDDNSQGNIAPQTTPKLEWDWGEDGNWDVAAREDDANTQVENEKRAARTEALQAEIGERFHRALEAERINTERRVRLELERDGPSAAPDSHDVPISGNYPPARDADAGMTRIGGRIVGG
jgi:hypothetical protein